MSTIIINNANKEEVSVISKLAKLLKLTVTTKKQEAVPSKAGIEAAIEAYESGQRKRL